jgi:predicted acylesterase/phospholipase RssA
MRLRKCFIGWLALLIFPLTASAHQTGTPLHVRVGVISYEDFGKTFEEYKGVFSRVMKSNASGKPVIFHIAVGTYGDVLDWYNRNLIDLALLTPEPITELLSSVKGADELRDLYIATRATVPIKTPPQYDYKAMCVVSASSPLRSFDDVREWAQRGQVNFLFVHPLSVSGSILPRYLLNRVGISNIGEGASQANSRLPLNPVEWTFSHQQSLETLSRQDESNADINDSNQHVHIAFVSERELNDKVRRLPFPEMDAQPIPQEALLINKKFMPYKQLLKNLFIKGSPVSEFAEVHNWIDRFISVKEWVNTVGVSSHDLAAQRISLSQIGNNLRNFQCRYHKPARLALVLSGGGAKCSYQVGAVEALESELAAAPDEQKGERKVDIDLVVGTSGGAINALLVGLGLTGVVENQQEIEKTWETFDQRQFFSPWSLPRLLFGILAGMLQAMLILRLADWLIKRQQEVRTAIVLIAVALFDWALVLLAWNPPWKYMGSFGKRHTLHHVWLVSTLNLDISAYALLAFGVAILVMALRSKPRAGRLKLIYHTGKTVTVCWVILIIGISLFYEVTLSQSRGVETTLAQRLPQVLNHHPDIKDQIELPANQKEPLQYISTKIVEQRLLKRDLIITGSRLSADDSQLNTIAAAEGLPDDLYFYYDHRMDQAATANVELPVDPRFVPVGSSLLDVVVGSSSIYPFFPAKHLGELQLPGKGATNVDIIDGGFAHNSPIEAAILWGATHIILIEASPEVSPARQNLFDNAIAAFNHLYLQAQLVDAHSRGKVEIYSLRPALAQPGEIPNLCVFDFSDILIRTAIADGRRDALDESHPRFRRESGEPNFRELVPSAGCDDLISQR